MYFILASSGQIYLDANLFCLFQVYHVTSSNYSFKIFDKIRGCKCKDCHKQLYSQHVIFVNSTQIVFICSYNFHILCDIRILRTAHCSHKKSWRVIMENYIPSLPHKMNGRYESYVFTRLSYYTLYHIFVYSLKHYKAVLIKVICDESNFSQHFPIMYVMFLFIL